MRADRTHLIQLSRIALLVTVGDLVTKAAAKRFLVNDPTHFTDTIQFAVVHNTQGAFGWSVGAYTWQLNLALTLAAIVFTLPVARDLARIDAAAPRALGLIVGGALGNLASLLTSPEGVVDFIAVSFATSGLVLNVADVAAYAGLGMILRTGVLLARAIRTTARVHLPTHAHTVHSVFAEQQAASRPRGLATSRDREVAVVDWSDVAHAPRLVADAPASTLPRDARRARVYLPMPAPEPRMGEHAPPLPPPT